MTSARLVSRVDRRMLPVMMVVFVSVLALCMAWKALSRSRDLTGFARCRTCPRVLDSLARDSPWRIALAKHRRLRRPAESKAAEETEEAGGDVAGSVHRLSRGPARRGPVAVPACAQGRPQFLRRHASARRVHPRNRSLRGCTQDSRARLRP